jgi:hypothetical protein
MKTFILSIHILLFAVSAWAVNGTFIQLNRASAEMTVEDWRADLEQMAEAGIDTLMVQWSSESPIAYFNTGASRMKYISENYFVLEKLFEANREIGHQVYLGLQNNSRFWSQIKSRDKVLRDFFLIRINRNETLQLALLDAFGEEENWVGYYIPDEIDDLTWRHETKRPVIKGYVSHMCERIRSNDSSRKIAMSAFFRGRTSPTILADTLFDICGGSGLDHLLIQDGIGVGDPPVHYVPFYFNVLIEKWANPEVDQTPILDLLPQVDRNNENLQNPEMLEAKGLDAGGIAEDLAEANQFVPMHAPPESEDTAAPPFTLPELWVVLEVFKQTSQEGEPFTATSTSPSQLKNQLLNAQDYFQNAVVFTFPDYMDPDLGDDAAKLFELIKNHNHKNVSSK